MKGDVVTDCLVVSEVDLTNLGYIEALGDDNKHSLAEGKEEHTWLNRNARNHLS